MVEIRTEWVSLLLPLQINEQNPVHLMLVQVFQEGNTIRGHEMLVLN